MNGVRDWKMKERRRRGTDGGGGDSGSTACLMHSPYGGLFISRPQSRSSPHRHLIRMQVSAGAADRRGIGGEEDRAPSTPPPISLFRRAPRPQNGARSAVRTPARAISI